MNIDSIMTAERVAELTACYRDGLLKDVLPFWMRHCIDREEGGFTMALDRDGTLLDSDKGMWQQGRFTWLLGHLYNTVEKREEWLELAKHGLDFIGKHGFDADGRMFFHVTRDGRPIRKRRYAFTETFACIAYGEAAAATGDSALAERAIAIFRLYQEYLDSGRMPPKFTDTRPTQGMGRPMIDIVTAQNLRRSVALPEADAVIERSIEKIATFFVKPELECVMETVGPKGEIYDHFDGRMLCPGHAIEGAWFILEEARHRGNDPGLIRLGCQMLDYMWERGWDKEYGGILYYRDLHGKPVQEYWHDMKFWWPQNETIIATLMAYLLTGDEKYARWHKLAHDWAYRYFPDPEHGEWFGYLHRDGRISVPLKGNLWKGPFHLPRMQLECWRLAEELSRKMATTT